MTETPDRKITDPSDLVGRTVARVHTFDDDSSAVIFDDGRYLFLPGRENRCDECGNPVDTETAPTLDEKIEAGIATDEEIRCAEWHAAQSLARQKAEALHRAREEAAKMDDWRARRDAWRRISLDHTSDPVPGPVPNPGSDAAIALGCLCPVLENNYGKGCWGTTGVFAYMTGVFACTADCPLHCRPLPAHETEDAAP